MSARTDSELARLPAFVVAVGGQVASGKSSVARELAEHLGAIRVEADRVRDALLQHGDDRDVPEANWGYAFAPGFVDKGYAELMRQAERALEDGHSVVLDACFASADQRGRALALARRRGAVFLFVECQAPAEIVRARLQARDATSPRRGWQAIHEDLAARWEPPRELGGDEHSVVSTDGPVERAVSMIEARLRARCAVRPPREHPARPAAVTFDCWNTLIFEHDWPQAHALRVTNLQAAAREAGHAVSYEKARRAFDAAWERHMLLWLVGQATGAQEVARWGLETLGLAEPHPALEHLVQSFQEASHSSRVQRLEGARETLRALAAADIPCALICDTGLTPGHVVRHHLDRLGLLQGLAVQIFSDEIGFPKPDPRAFRAALLPLGVSPEHALHVGDLRRTDVAGARGLGMASVRISHHHDDTSELPEADFVVSNHTQLRSLLALEGEPRPPCSR